MNTCSLPTATSPNLTTFIFVGDVQVNFRFHGFRDVLYVSIWTESYRVDSVRCINKSWLLPKGFFADIAGNFRFETADSRYPWYTDFNKICLLKYYTEEEVDAIEIERNGIA